MATLFYGSDTAPISLPDRLMGYIKVITSTKLRRGESFTLTWTGTDEESGRSTIWLQPAIPLRFVFESPSPSSSSAITPLLGRSGERRFRPRRGHPHVGGRRTGIPYAGPLRSHGCSRPPGASRLIPRFATRRRTPPTPPP